MATDNGPSGPTPSARTEPTTTRRRTRTSSVPTPGAPAEPPAHVKDEPAQQPTPAQFQAQLKVWIADVEEKLARKKQNKARYDKKADGEISALEVQLGELRSMQLARELDQPTTAPAPRPVSAHSVPSESEETPLPPSEEAAAQGRLSIMRHSDEADVSTDKSAKGPGFWSIVADWLRDEHGHIFPKGKIV